MPMNSTSDTASANCNFSRRPHSSPPRVRLPRRRAPVPLVAVRGRCREKRVHARRPWFGARVCPPMSVSFDVVARSRFGMEMIRGPTSPPRFSTPRVSRSGLKRTRVRLVPAVPRASPRVTETQTPAESDSPVSLTPPVSGPSVVRHENTLLPDSAAQKTPFRPSPLAPAAQFKRLSSPPEWALGSTNPPLSGNFAPVVGTCEITNLVVHGSIPASAAGVFLRNGPNPAFEPKLGPDRYHWFDGDGMLHWVLLRSGTEGRDGDDRESGGGEVLGSIPGPGRTGIPNVKTDKTANNSSSASYGRSYVATKNLQREMEIGETLFTGLRDISPIWNVLVPRLVEKLCLDWRKPDTPFWVVQSKVRGFPTEHVERRLNAHTRPAKGLFPLP